MAIYHDTPYLKVLAKLRYPSLNANPQVNIVERGDRTGTGTRAYFGEQMRFNLREGFPLLTTKKVNFSAVVHELLWFLSGSTNVKDLNSKIWNDWAVDWSSILTHLLDRYQLRGTDGSASRILLSEDIIQTNPQDGGSAPEGWREREVNLGGAAVTEYLHPDYEKICVERLVDEGFVPRSLVEQLSQRLDELGPIYGKQWRSWPTYVPTAQSGHHEIYAEDTPIDQIGQLIENLKTKPYSRRHVISAWNPAVLPDEDLSPQENAIRGNMALAPCHCLFQFFVAPLSLVQRLELLIKHIDLLSVDETFWLKGILEKKQEPIDPNIHDEMVSACDRRGVPVHELSCQMYQRSADICLGVPFNIASYALLTHLVASVCNMEVGDYIHTFGDIHLYNNHAKGAAEQVTHRTPLPSPKVVINPAVKSIDMFTINDITLEGYEHHPPIKFDVSV